MRPVIAIAAIALLAGCTVPEEKFAREADGTVTFVSQAYDLFPMRTDVAEAWRMQELRRRLESENLCPDSVAVESRTESLAPMGEMHEYEGFRSLEGDILEVSYRARCPQ